MPILKMQPPAPRTKVTFQAKLLNKRRTRTSKIVEIKRDEEIKEGGRLEWKNYMVEVGYYCLILHCHNDELENYIFRRQPASAYANFTF